MTSKEIDAVFEEAEESRDPEADLKQLEEMVQEMVSKCACLTLAERFD